MAGEADGVMPSRRLELVADQAEELAAALADGARAQHEDGDLLGERPSFELAYRLAEQAGDVQAMAVAALGLAGLWVCERRAVAGAVLLEARLQRVLSLLDARSFSRFGSAPGWPGRPTTSAARTRRSWPRWTRCGRRRVPNSWRRR